MRAIPAAGAWQEGRRRSARAAIVDAAWAAVREEGLAGLAMRDLAQRAGVSTPTLYAYFESKNAIYDAMFAEAAELFTARMGEPLDGAGPREVLVSGARRFVEFCTEDVARYQLLFQRVIPGFEPSAASYAHAVAALDTTRQRMAAMGITGARHLDMWTALLTGLVDQQISNDPGGDRWARLVDDAVTMFLGYCTTGGPQRSPTRRSRPTSPSKGARR